MTQENEITGKPIIVDLLKWIKENLPSDADENEIFKKVRIVDKYVDGIVNIFSEELYRISHDSCDKDSQSMNQGIDKRLEDLKSIIKQSEIRLEKTDQLDKAGQQLEMIKQRHEFVSSLKLDGTMDTMKRYERLVNKKL